MSVSSRSQQALEKAWETSMRTVIQLHVHKVGFSFSIWLVILLCLQKDFVSNYKTSKLKGTASQETRSSVQGDCHILKEAVLI